MQVEELGGGTLVNGNPIEGRVEVEYPASVQLGSVTLVVEEKLAAVDISSAVTIPQRPAAKSSASLSTEVTIVTRPRPQAVVSPRPTDLNEAETLCRYTLVREIARGGMGQIYFGEDSQLKRQVAIKVSSISEGGEDPRFAKEAEVLAHLAHPNIVPIYNIGVDAQSRPFYSMKLVKGRTLQAVLNAVRDGDAAAVKEYQRSTLLTIFRKVCDAMAFAHAKGVLHRDLKPENIMVGEYGEVLVMDWGLAKVLGGGEDTAAGKSPARDTGDYGMTMEGEVMGTPQYMSPEQAEGVVAELDARSDIYSLGGILYAVLTLRPPIDGKTLNEVLTKVKKGEITSMATRPGGKRNVNVGTPAAMGVEVPEALQAVTLKAMATDRSKRYESVEAFAADIEAYQNGFATSAENAGALRQMALFIKRHKGVSAAAALFLVAAAGFVVKLAASERVARAHEQHALSEMEKSRREAAQTSLTLAELSEKADDLEGFQRALNSIPPDLRDPTWRYLEAKIDQSDRQIVPAEKTDWVGLENHPTNPNLFVALQSDGQLCSLNPETGEVASLWKADNRGRAPFFMSLSEDGKWVAIAYRRAGKNPGSELQVYEFGSGKSGSAPVVWGESAFFVRISERNLIAVSAPDGSGAGRIVTCVCWDWRTGKQLWEKPKFIGPRFSKSGAEVMGFLPEGFTRLAADTGEVLSPPVKPVMNLLNWMVPNSVSYMFEGNTIYGGSGDRLSLVNMANNSLVFSIRSEGEIQAMGIPAAGDLMGVGRVVKNSVKLELRKRSNGDLLRTALLKGSHVSGPNNETSLRINAVAVALRVYRDPRKIRIWDLKRTELVHQAPLAKRSSAMWLGEGDEGLVFTRTVEKNWALEKVDFRLGPRTPKGKPLMTLEGRYSSSGDLLGSISPNGDWVISQGFKEGVKNSSGSHFWSVYAAKVEDGEAREVWSKPLSGFTAFHPVKKELWIARHLLDLTTGQEISSINLPDYRQRIGYSRPVANSALWVGEDSVLEPVEKSVAGDNGSEKQWVKMLALWNVKDSKLEVEVPAPYTAVLAASPDGRVVLEGGLDKRLRVRDGKTLELKIEFRAHDASLTGAVWHPTRPLVATSSTDGFIRIWNRNDWTLVEEIRTEFEKGCDLTVSKSGKRLLAMAFDRDVQVYEPRCFSE